MTLEEFTDRFNAELESILGFKEFSDGRTVRAYSESVARLYYNDDTLLDEEGNHGPEECAREDHLYYWED